jgi:hypothetical protein
MTPDPKMVLAEAMAEALPKPMWRSSWTAIDIMLYKFPEPRFAVPGLIAEGLNILAGAPKLGKSWFALNIAAAVAYGGLALDAVSVEQGEVLYLALEDTPRRLQSRLRMVLCGEHAPAGLYFETAWPVLLDGGSELLEEWLTAHPRCRLVVIDVFAKVRGVSNPNVDQYEADYAAMTTLKTIADKHTVAIIVVHHTRKAQGADWLDEVSGTQGLSGAADAVLVLSRSRGSADATLKITGRDVEEAEHAMRFDATAGVWALLDGPADEYTLGATRRALAQHLREHGQSTPKLVAAALDLEHELVKKTLRRMASDEQIGTDGQGAYYHLSPLSLLSPEEGHKGQEGQEREIRA